MALGDQPEQGVGDGIWRGFAGSAAIPLKILPGQGLGEGAAQIGEGVLGATCRGVASVRGLREAVAEDPGQGGGQQAEVEVVVDSFGRARLGLSAADVLFDLFEPGFDFPPSPIEFDDLSRGEGQIGGEEGDLVRAPKDPNESHTALEGLEPDEAFGELDRLLTSIELEGFTAGLGTQTLSEVFDGAQTRPVFGWTSAFSARRGQQVVEGGIDAHPGEQIDLWPQGLTHRLPQPVVAKPAVGDDQDGGLGKHDGQESQQACSLSERGLEAKGASTQALTA